MEEYEISLLEVVGESGGQLDTRQLDFEYYARSAVLLEPNLLQVLREFESRGLVQSVAIECGVGPGWTLTDLGVLALKGGTPS